jgi:hypothetical protein
MIAIGFLNPLDAGGQVSRRDSAQRQPSHRDSVLVDSLAERLRRAEEAIAILQQQLAEESESAVRTSSRFKLDLTGRLLTNTYYTSGRVNNIDVPQLALSPRDSVTSGRALGISVRQTRLGAALTVDSVLGGTLLADVDVDFFGGTQTGPGGRRLFPEVRLRTFRGIIDWKNTELMVGTVPPLISDLNPLSLAAVGTTGFVAAGNLWNWLPQIRLTRELGGVQAGDTKVRFAIGASVMEPFSGTQVLNEPDAVDAGERSGRPFLEGRLRARWGEAESAGPLDAFMGHGGGEIAISGHRGWVARAGGEVNASKAIAADWRVSLTRWLEIRGEAYVGQLVSGLGGGGIGQSFGTPVASNIPGPVIRDVAGWTQVNFQPSPIVVAGMGCGVDDPRDADRPVRLRNSVCAAHVALRPIQPIVVGAEYRRIDTRYAAETMGANHLNLAIGVEF